MNTTMLSKTERDYEAVQASARRSAAFSKRLQEGEERIAKGAYTGTGRMVSGRFRNAIQRNPLLSKISDFVVAASSWVNDKTPTANNLFEASVPAAINMSIAGKAFSFARQPVYVSNEFAKVIDDHLAVQQRTIADINSEKFIGPLPQNEFALASQHGIGTRDFANALAYERGIITCDNGTPYLTCSGLKRLEAENPTMNTNGSTLLPLFAEQSIVQRVPAEPARPMDLTKPVHAEAQAAARYEIS